MILTKRFDEAFCLASELHRNQKRKNSDVPYMTHLMAVSSMVCENIETLCKDQNLAEDYVITAMLHDAIEDQGGLSSYEKVKEMFGQFIADSIMLLSDCVPEGGVKPDKPTRNKVYREKLSIAPKEIVLISCCDKIHNLRTMVSDYDLIGEKFWGKFSQSPENTVKNYETLGEVYVKRLGNHRVIKMYREALDALKELIPTT